MDKETVGEYFDTVFGAEGKEARTSSGAYKYAKLKAWEAKVQEHQATLKLPDSPPRSTKVASPFNPE